MLFEIKRQISGAVLFSLECGSMKLCVEAAVLQSADLRYANLQSANLQSADLQSANLRYANLRYANLRYANLQSANLRYANLQSANLRYANLQSADLQSANLQYANLRYAKIEDSTPLPTGESFGKYKAETLPVLLTAGGKTIEQVAAGWDCHEWNNCPMAIAFNFNGNYEKASPIVTAWRPRIEQFVQLFDAKMLPNPLGRSASETSCEVKSS